MCTFATLAVSAVAVIEVEDMMAVFLNKKSDEYNNKGGRIGTASEAV
jgi:hypothetical protein